MLVDKSDKVIRRLRRALLTRWRAQLSNPALENCRLAARLASVRSRIAELGEPVIVAGFDLAFPGEPR